MPLRRYTAVAVLLVLSVVLRCVVIFGGWQTCDVPQWMQLGQALLGTVLVWLVATLGWSLLPDRPLAGTLAALAAACYPPHVLLVTTRSAGLLVGVMLVGALCCAVTRGGHRGLRGPLGFGLLAAVTVVVFPWVWLGVAACMLVYVVCALARRAGGNQPDEESETPDAGSSARALPPLRRLGLVAGAAALLLLPWVGSRWLAARGANGATMSIGAADVAGPSAASRDVFFRLDQPRAAEDGAGQGRLPELRTALIDPPAGVQWSRTVALATIAWIVTALIGAAVSCGHFRSLWPTYAAAILFAVPLFSAAARPESRPALEAVTLAWSVWCVVPLLSRRREEPIRVYRPGEQGHDPLESPHVLRGPHFSNRDRRRAG